MSITFRRLDVTYRNSAQIQMFYNVYLAHYNQSMASKDNDDILTGMMQQPEMDTKASSSQNGCGTSLPYGQKPTFFIINEKTTELSENDSKFLRLRILETIDSQDSRLSVICIRYNEKECRFCRSLNSKYQNTKDIKLFQKGNFFETSGYRGCEQDNLIIHFDYLLSDARVFECISRARKTLTVILSKTRLQGQTIKEMIRHETECTNKVCKDNGWDKLKVIDIR